jgi:hypothetical protein
MQMVGAPTGNIEVQHAPSKSRQSGGSLEKEDELTRTES